MKTEVIAFDVHNTLARFAPERVSSIEVQDLLARFGVETSYQSLEAARQYVFFFDTPKREIHGYVDFLALQFDHMGLRVNLDVIESIAAMYDRRDSMVLFDDALTAIEMAKAKDLRVVAFTTLPKFMLGRAADELLPKLDAYFDASATGYAKGDPRFYASITQSLAVPPHAIRCIGDNLTGDCLLPQRAGWQPTWLNRRDAQPSNTFPTVHSLTDFAATF
ncbi:MAG: HAD family hydrolase [Phycisphaerales bacterium]|nr:HAD family hydrolase [Phycisphaerales bacterium]